MMRINDNIDERFNDLLYRHSKINHHEENNNWFEEYVNSYIRAENPENVDTVLHYAAQNYSQTIADNRRDGSFTGSQSERLHEKRDTLIASVAKTYSQDLTAQQTDTLISQAARQYSQFMNLYSQSTEIKEHGDKLCV